ncbi:MAG: hypothetical protein AAF594_10260 [Bacteroidota bacterium]
MLRLLAVSVLLALAAGCASDPQAPYVGTWVPEADSLDTRTTFFADGTARIVRRLGGEPQAFEARFEVRGDTLLTLFDPDGAERFRVRLDGDTLRLGATAGGPEAVWVRL